MGIHKRTANNIPHDLILVVHPHGPTAQSPTRPHIDDSEPVVPPCPKRARSKPCGSSSDEMAEVIHPLDAHPRANLPNILRRRVKIT
jgi:hypothetical protein